MRDNVDGVATKDLERKSMRASQSPVISPKIKTSLPTSENGARKSGGMAKPRAYSEMPKRDSSWSRMLRSRSMLGMPDTYLHACKEGQADIKASSAMHW